MGGWVDDEQMGRCMMDDGQMGGWIDGWMDMQMEVEMLIQVNACITNAVS